MKDVKDAFGKRVFVSRFDFVVKLYELILAFKASLYYSYINRFLSIKFIRTIIVMSIEFINLLRFTNKNNLPVLIQIMSSVIRHFS